MKVKLIKAVPLMRGFSKELSYFSLKNISKGSLVGVKLLNREIPALVVSAEEMEKSDIKLLPYSLKRIPTIKTEFIFLEEFIKAAEKTADYFLCGSGNIIKELCPQAILKNPPALNPPKKNTDTEKLLKRVSVLQKPKEERIKFYKNLIRAEFASGKSIFLCLPSAQKIKQHEEELKKGIERRVFAFHSKMEEKELREKWTEAVKETQPILIIATGLFLSLPRNDIKNFILEEESSPLYKSTEQPFLDLRIAVENLCEETESSLVLADELMRLQTYKGIKEKQISESSPIPAKIISRTEEALIGTLENKSFLTPKLREILETSTNQNEQVLLFINRRGYELSTVCNDCGRVLSCVRCDTPLVLHKKLGQEKEFLCHKCFLKIKVADNCPYCKSWRLKSLGFGIQKIEEEIKKTFPEIKIFRMDSDSTKTQRGRQKIIGDYLASPGSVLLSTEIIFSFPEIYFDRVGVISVDGLLNIPDFSINERVFRLLIKLKGLARKTFLIQTRFAENPIFQNILKGEAAEFFESELSAREKFGYPPFKTLVKISCGIKNKENQTKEIKILEQRLEKYNPLSFIAFTPMIKNLRRFHLLLKLDQETWPKKQRELCDLLFSLPSKWKVEINPVNLV